MTEGTVGDVKVTRVEGFICLTNDMRWAWGMTPEDAVRSAKAMSGDFRVDRWVTVQLPPGALDAWVDQMGAVNWDWAEGADTSGHITELPKHSMTGGA